MKMVPPKWNNTHTRHVNARQRRLRVMENEARTAMRRIGEFLQSIVSIVRGTNLRNFLRLFRQCLAMESTMPVHDYLNLRRRTGGAQMSQLIDRVGEVFDLCLAVDVQQRILRDVAHNLFDVSDSDGRPSL